MRNHGPRWYAVHTYSRHEKQIEAFFRRQKIETYLPLQRTWSRRKDRKVTLEEPALPGYLFVYCTLYAELRALIKRTSGVVGLVQNAGQPAVIPEQQIETLRIALSQKFKVSGHPYLTTGDRVRVIRGPLIGAEGYLMRVRENQHRLVISVDYVNQALTLEIAATDVERIG